VPGGDSVCGAAILTLALIGGADMVES